METPRPMRRRSDRLRCQSGTPALLVWATVVVVLAVTASASGATATSSTPGAAATAPPAAAQQASGDRCAQCEAFLRHAPGRTKACEELCALTWPDYNCHWICTRLAELHAEGSEAPCWDIGYCKEREIRELQEKQRREEARDPCLLPRIPHTRALVDTPEERLRREALEAAERQRERERRATEEARRRSEEAARREIEEQRRALAASELERERKLLADEWTRLQRERDTLAREREIVELEKKRIELIKAQQSSETTTGGGGGGSGGGGELTRQRLLRERAKEALRVIEAKATANANANANAGTAAASPVSSSTPSPAMKEEQTPTKMTTAEVRQQASRERPEASSGAGTQMRATTTSAPSGAPVWCAWDCSDVWSWNGVLKVFIFFISYLLYAVALEWVEERLLSGVSEDFDAIQRQLRVFGVVSQLMAVALSGVFLFFGWMAFRHELSLPLFAAPLGQKCLTVASYLPKELYLFLFLTGQVGKRLALAGKAGFEWVARVRRILAAQRHLHGTPWARVARDAATLRFAEYVFLLLFLVDSLGAKESDNHTCAEVAAFLLACEIVALLLNLAVTFPNTYIRQARTFPFTFTSALDVLTGITESGLFLLLARFIAEAWGGDARLTLLSLPILVFRLINVASLLRPAVTSLLAPKQKTT